MTSHADPLVRFYLDRLGLQPFLDEPGVEDIAVQEPGVVWVRRGSWTHYDIPQADFLTLEEFAIVSGSLNRQEHGSHRPILDTGLPDNNGGSDGPRLNVVGFPHVRAGTIAVTIRKHDDVVSPPEAIRSRYITDGWNKYVGRAKRNHDDELLEIYDSGDEVAFVKACARTRQNVVLAGHTGSSKSELAKTFFSAFDDSKRIITIEDARELTILQPNHVRLTFNRNDLAENAVDARTLAQAATRMHPDIVILGEMRGKEAWTFVRDVIPPHPGSVIGIHANSPSSAFSRIIALCKGDPGAASYDDRALAVLVANVVDVIIPLEQIDKKFHWHPVWFRAAAHRDGQTALDLLDEAA